MAIDIRADVSCSLGSLISASVNDDYLQGNGLVKTRGSCEINGVITPAIGTEVTFSYVKAGVTHKVPRKLRVLSSFADPFRRTTRVELGCKLTYLQDLKEPVNWKALQDPANTGLTEADAKIITIPIHASSVMNQCLTKLGITANRNPLTNKFSIEKFDFGPGYVDVLANLLVSESYCGYLDEAEVLQVVSLAADGGTGPVINGTNLIDLNGIGVGQLPGEAVTVSYSSLKLQSGEIDPAQGSNWSTSKASSRSFVVVPYTSPSGVDTTETFNTFETTISNTFTMDVEDENGRPTNVVRERTTSTVKSASSVLGSLIAAFLSNGIPYGDFAIHESTREVFTYAHGKVIRRVFTRYESMASGMGSVGVPLVFSSSSYVSILSGSYLAERTIQIYNYFDSGTQVETIRYGPWIQSLNGQQTMAEGSKNYSTPGASAALISAALSGEYLIDYSVTLEKGDETQRAPSDAEAINAANSKTSGNPNNGYRTDSKAELSLAMGSATAQRRTEFSLPYAPDDTFRKDASGKYLSTASDAAAKANLYGRVQNKLLLGNRSGANFQLAPEVLPAAPFAPFIVQANGLSAMYRSNGTAWTMDATGVVVSTDALFWGAVGGTGSTGFWFPVAPGITALPPEPPVVGGQMTVGAVVPVWNETVSIDATVRIGLTAVSLPYALSAVVPVPGDAIHVGLTASSFRGVTTPAVGITLQALAPSVQISATVTVASTPDITIAALPAKVATGASVTTPISNIAIGTPEINYAGAKSTNVHVPVGMITIAGLAPGAGGGKVLAVPSSNIAVAGLAPGKVGPVVTDPYFNNVVLLLHFDGANGSKTVTDSSTKNLAATANDSAIVSTGASRFGGSSLYMTRNVQDSVDVAASTHLDFGTGDFTVEYWYLFVSRENSNNCRILGHTTTTEASGTFRIRVQSYTSNGGVIGEHMLCAANTASNRLVATRQSVINGAWNHIAFCRGGGTMRCFVNGVLKESAADPTDYNHGSVGGMRIGSRGGGVNEFSNCYMDDIRVTKGVARYLADFTPPSAPFPDA